MQDYKSSDQRLACWFKQSRDTWQERASKKQKQLRYQAVKIRDLEQSRAQWKQRAQVAEKALKAALAKIPEVGEQDNPRLQKKRPNH